MELSSSRITDGTMSEENKKLLNQMMVCGLGSKGRCRQMVWNSLALVRYVTFFKHTSSFIFVSKWTFKPNMKNLVNVIWLFVKIMTNELFSPYDFVKLRSLFLELKEKINSMKPVYAVVVFGLVIKPNFWASLAENDVLCSLLDKVFLT